MLCRMITAILAIACCCTRAEAQILYGGLVGNVTDKSDAAVLGAAVTVANQETGALRL